MSLWNWKRSGWINLTLAVFLILAVLTNICSSGLRTRFHFLAPNFSFQDDTYPEVGFFNFLLISSAIFGFMSVALRYSYIMDQVQVMPTFINYINKFSVSLGVISFLGLIIIASFSTPFIEKEITSQTVGTYLFFGVGILFTLFQTVLTYSSARYSFTFYIRLLLTLLLMPLFLCSIVFSEKSRERDSPPLNPSNSSSIMNVSFAQRNETHTIWSHKEKDILTACILEWISVVIYALFYISFFQEFQTISAYVILRPFIGSTSNDFRSSSLTVNERV